MQFSRCRFVMDCLERIVMENKISLARTISIIGTLILCIALVGNSFEVLSVTAFRIIIAFGILIQIISLICMRKEKRNFKFFLVLIRPKLLQMSRVY